MLRSTRNTADRAADLVAVLLDTPAVENVSEVLRAYGERGPGGDLGLTAGDVAAMREAAARLREVFAAADLDEAAGLLNRILAESARPPRLTTHDGTADWHLHADGEDDAPWAEWFLVSSAMALAMLLTEHRRMPGGICAAPGCDRPFADSSPGSPRRFCSSRCATRARVAGHRTRRAVPPAAPGGPHGAQARLPERPSNG
ncbi:CGNR zinc finger domain-containing protein [Streptosporangium sp. NPDC004379]|uniref:CGNR zinc finger domain-containing protein n=1 Tax=Streptosporangium sp. NPDC004379 TaxID=3366189 RepID=UPI00368F9292